MTPRRVEPAIVRTFEEARRAFEGEAELAVDLETGGLSAFRDPIHVITLYGPTSNTIAILHYPRGVKVDQRVIQWLGDVPEIITHNGTQFDTLFLARAGMAWDRPRLYDTMIGELCVKVADRHDVRVNLQDTLKRRLGKEIDKSIDHGSWGNEALDEAQRAYCAGDIAHLIDLKRRQLEEADETTTRCIEFEMALAKAVVRMELNGLPVDLPALELFFEERGPRHEATCAQLEATLGPINVGSWQQLIKAFNDRLGYTLPDTKGERLQNLAYGTGVVAETCQAILNWRTYQQRANMFGPEWRANHVILRDGVWYVHGKYWQVGTNTGRFSSSEPNMQQVPRNMRGAFGGYDHLRVIKADYKSIEVRVAAALAGDEEMLKVINEGVDIHSEVAATIFKKPIESITPEERRVAKGGSFTFLFGGSWRTLYENAHANGSTMTQEEAQAATATFFTRFAGVYRSRQVAEYVASRYRQKVIEYPTGLRRQLFGSSLKSTTLLNNSVQGTAAAGLKIGILEAERRGVSKYLAAVVHDELVMVTPNDLVEEVRAEIEECMIYGMKEALKDCPPVSIGVESQWGSHWSGDHKTERSVESGI